jgi:acetyl esterase/lipase
MDVRSMTPLIRIAFASLLLIAVPRALAAPLSIESLAQFEAVTSVSLSPDGKHVVGLVAAPGQKWPVISIWNADALEQTPVWIPSQNMRPTRTGFLSNERVWFIAEQEINRGSVKTFTRKLFVTDLKGSRFSEPLKRGGSTNDAVRNVESTVITVSVFNDLLEQKDVVLLERSDIGQGGVQQIYRYDAVKDQATLVGEGTEKAFFLENGVNLATGELLIQQKLALAEGEAKELGNYWVSRYIRANARSPWVQHPALSYPLKQRLQMEILGFDSDPNKLLVSTNLGSNYARIRSYDIAAKRFDPEPLFENDKYDIDGVVFRRDSDGTRSIIGITVGGPAVETVYTDTVWKPVHAALKREFPGRTVTIATRRTKLNRALIMVESDAHPPSYYLVNTMPKLSIAKIGSERPWIDATKLGETRWVRYKARDGLEIPVILTLPPGWTPEKGRVPAVVNPHGGPWARDYLGWDGSGWTQFLATRGYAVLRPQYRGSAGLGLELWRAGDQNWGLKMQDDKDDGAAWLVEQGIADPRKIAMFGYSYGGFAAIAASVRPDGPYVCALSGAGVSSLALIQNEWGDSRIQRELQGDTVKGLDPLKNVDKADIPILLFHGDRDRQADTEHSRLFYAAMKKAGKDVQYVEIKDMWHTLPWRPEWHRQSLKLIEDWLAGPKCFGGPGKQLTANSAQPPKAD